MLIRNQDVKAHFADGLWLLKDMVNYGSNLIPRCFVDSGRELPDIIVLPVLLRQTGRVTSIAPKICGIVAGAVPEHKAGAV